MHKKLFAFGRGSLAMVLDADLRRPLGIGLDTLLHITREGNRIVIERSTCEHVPVVEEPKLADASGYDIRLLRKLMRDLDSLLPRQDFARLSHDEMGLFEFIGTLSCGGPLSAVTIARLEAFLDKRKKRVPHEDAIEAVLAEFPDELPPTRRNSRAKSSA